MARLRTLTYPRRKVYAVRVDRLPHVTRNGRGWGRELTLVLAVADLLARGGSVVVVGGEPLAPSWVFVQEDDGPWELREVPRWAAPGLRCVWPDGQVWLVATVDRVGAERLLERALAELELVA